MTQLSIFTAQTIRMILLLAAALAVAGGCKKSGERKAPAAHGHDDDHGKGEADHDDHGKSPAGHDDHGKGAAKHDDHGKSAAKHDDHGKGEAGHDDHQGESAADSHAGDVHHDEAKGEPDRVELSGVKGVRFVAAPARAQEGAWFPAEAVGDENAQNILSAPVGGIVASLTAAGKPQRRGAPLLTLRSPEAADLYARYQTAVARKHRADRDQAREQRLMAANAGSRRDLETAESEAAIARADLSAAVIALESRGLRPGRASGTWSAFAPANGSVVTWKVLLGQSVPAGSELGLFQASAAALARLEMTPPGAPTWRIGDEAQARNTDGRSWKAVVEGLPATLNADTRRLAYRLRLSGAALPLPGTPIEVRVPLAEAISLPQSALQQVEGVWGIFVKEDKLARFQPVKRGTEIGGHVLVSEGVKPGEEVAAEGAYLLKTLLLRSRGEEAGHEH